MPTSARQTKMLQVKVGLHFQALAKTIGGQVPHSAVSSTVYWQLFYQNIQPESNSPDGYYLSTACIRKHRSRSRFLLVVRTDLPMTTFSLPCSVSIHLLRVVCISTANQSRWGEMFLLCKKHNFSKKGHRRSPWSRLSMVDQSHQLKKPNLSIRHTESAFDTRQWLLLLMPQRQEIAPPKGAPSLLK